MTDLLSLSIDEAARYIIKRRVVAEAPSEVIRKHAAQSWNLATTPIDRAKARAVVRKLYSWANFETHIPIFYARDPLEAAALLQDLGDKPKFPLELSLEELDAWADTIKPSLTWREVEWLPHDERKAILGHLEHIVENKSRVVFAATYRTALECQILDTPTPEIDLIIQSGEDLGEVIPYMEAVVLIDRPHTLLLDEKGQYHGEGIPAIEYCSGWKRYFSHGTPLPNT